MEEQETYSTESEEYKQLIKVARSLAISYNELLAHRKNKWFKPIHLKRETGESEKTIKEKLESLSRLGFVVIKQEYVGDIKYMLQITEEQKKIYLLEVKELLEAQLKEIEDLLQKFD